MQQKLFKKPSDMTYTKMAMWIDENFYKEGCDHSKAYSYMYLLGYMLAAKQKFFNDQKDYEEFAAMLAYDTYQRMISPNKAPLKSVLNYMKSILFFRKGLYKIKKAQKIIDPKYDNWDSVAYIEKCKDAYETSNRGDLFKGVIETLEEAPNIIKKSIPKVFKHDKVLYKNIYISCLLSMVNRITLPSQYDDKLDFKLNSSPGFDEVKYYKKYLDNDIILWHLPETMSSVIVVILNKVNLAISNEIKDLSNDIKISDTDFSHIMTSGFTSGGSNEADY